MLTRVSSVCRVALSVVPLLVALIVAAPAAAQLGTANHSDSANGLTIKPAPKWMRADPAVISEVDSIFADNNPYRTCSVKMVWVRGSSDKLEYPYIYLEITPVDLSTFSAADIERAFDAPFKPERASTYTKPIGQIAAAMANDEIAFDRAKSRLYEKIQGSDEDGTALTEIVVGLLGKSCVAHLGYVAESKQTDLYMQDFQTFLDGFKWNSGMAWTPPSNNLAAAAAGTLAATWIANRSMAQIQAADAKAVKKTSRASSSNRFPRFGVKGIGALAMVVILGLGALAKWSWST